MENAVKQLIIKTPGICGGRACIAGHRIRVQDIVLLHEMRGRSAQEILAEYPGITLADVEAALAYYSDHRQEIQEDFRKSDEWAEWVKANIPSKITAKQRENRGG
jgi:uncharacterized protein (DUF433 family)